MKKTLILFLIVIALAVNLATAEQLVYGRVFDIGGMVLVPGASVKVTVNNTMNYTTTSLANGSYYANVNYAVGDPIKVEAIKLTRGITTAYGQAGKTEINVTLLTACSDGMDNDGDGKIDAADWGCYNEDGVYLPSKNSEINPQCSDGTDNDADTYTDSADPGCHKYYIDGTHEYKPYLNNESKHPQCFDKVDNDEDCFTDYPLDRGCDSIFDNKELNEPHYGDGSAWINIAICSEDFKPMIWMCGGEDTRGKNKWGRIMLDDGVEPGRISNDGDNLVERMNNYAFEGEQIQWKVLVLDKNGYEKIRDVYVTVEGDIEANCNLDHVLDKNDDIANCYNARIDEEVFELATAGNMFAEYTCTFTVETPNSMHEEYWVTAAIEDLDGLVGEMDEKEYWYFNPEVALSINGELDFGVVRPGTDAYSKSITIGNAAEDGSGVMLDMFITGTDFYDPSSSGAKCPDSNQLSLSNLRYYAVNGAYSTMQDFEADSFVGVQRDRDAEGYVNIEYGSGFNQPSPFYNNAEILQAQQQGPYYVANILAPGAEFALTFKLSLPEPCNGDFTEGDVYFWGEAI